MSFLLFLLFQLSLLLGRCASVMCNGQLCDPDCNHCNICSPTNCVSTSTQDCYCASKSIPGNLPLDDTPQFMIFTFDDSLERRFYDKFQNFAPFFKNPQIVDSLGCYLRGTAFVQNMYSDFGLISYFDKIGSVALHSVTHTLMTSSPYNEWFNEFTTGVEDIRALSKVNPKGGRAPNLAMTSDYLQMLKDIGMKYDSTSMYFPQFYNYQKSPSEQTGYWPYTLDFGFPEQSFCISAGCPTKTFPGLWEVPMFGFTKADGSAYNPMDYTVSNYMDFLKDIRNNFQKNYESNRVPIGMYFHYGYFQNLFAQLDVNRFQLIVDFFGWAKKSYSNIVFATESMVIDWIKNPIPFSQMATDPRFACPSPSYDITNSCNNPSQTALLCSFPDGESTLVCSSSCPSEKPGLGVDWYFLDGTPTGKTISSLPDAVNLYGNHWMGLGKYQFSSNSATYVCLNMFVDNPSSTMSSSFVYTLELCKANVPSISSFWGFNKVSLDTPNKLVIRQLATNQWVSGKGNYAGGWCSTVNNFNPSKHMRLSVDLYEKSILSSISPKNLIVYCGNGICDSSVENAINCPGDCSPLVC